MAVDYHLWQKKYYFMKYINKLMVEPLLGEPFLNIHEPQKPKIEDYFNQSGLVFDEILINALVNGTRKNLLKIIIFNIDRWNERSGEFFATDVTLRKDKSGQPDYIKNMIVLNVDPLLNQDDFYILDDHVRKSGHKKLAAQLLKIIKSTN